MSSNLSQFIAHETSHPEISVIIPACNSSKWIDRTIRTALEQSYPPCEVIVIDDDSEDDTHEQVARRALAAENVRYLRHANRRGAQAAWNTGLKNARGDWIALLEVGDTWRADKLSKQVAQILNSPFLPGVVYSGYRVIPKDNRQPPQERCYQFRGHVYRDLLSSAGLGPASTLLIKKEMLEEAGGFDERHPGYNEWELCLRLAQHCLFDLAPEPLVDYNLAGETGAARSRVNTVPAYLAVVNRYRDEMISECGQETLQSHYEQARQRYLAYADRLTGQRKYSQAARAMQLAGEIPPRRGGLLLQSFTLKTLPWLYRWFFTRDRQQAAR